MFDGIDRPPMRRPKPPRPAPLDTRRLLPLLSAQAAGTALEVLALALGADVIAAQRWIVDNWGAGANLRDPAHPAYVAALDPASPAAKLAEARDAVAAACRRYRAVTGRDGIAAARGIIHKAYGREVAKVALQPITDAVALSARITDRSSNGESLTAAELEMAIDHLIDDAPLPAPSTDEIQVGRSAIAEWMLTDPDLDGLTGRLGALLKACSAGCSGNVVAAIEALGDAVRDALARGYDAECMQVLLDCWSAATGGPKVNVTFQD